MRSLSIAWKDFRHVYRNIPALAMMLAAPLVLSLALGAAFGSGSSFSIKPVDTAIVNLDQGAATGGSGAAIGGQNAGATIEQILASPDVKDLVVLKKFATEGEARAAVDNGDASVAVIIPAGLTEAVSSPSGKSASITIYRDPSLTISPGIVSSIVQSAILSLNGARAAAAGAVAIVTQSGNHDPGVLTDAATKTAQAFGQGFQGQPPISIDSRAPSISASERAAPNVASQVLLGMMVFFMFFGASQPARSIIDEQRNATLARLFTTPTSRRLILGGKYVAVFMVVLIQSIILLVVGRLVFGAHWGFFGPVAVLTICGALVAASLALLMISLAKTPAQAGAFSSAVFVFLGLVGGNFVGSVNFTGPFAIVRRITPNGWLLEGWSKALYGGSWGSIGLPVLVVLASSAVFFAVATVAFGRRFA
ncbi:MAG: ABC transporter permease [Actinobacteria bacterium]|nr:ABC transporter permease [Actinomycetota bacterium]